MAQVRIYRPPKTAMQSGVANTRHWVLEYTPGARKALDPLTGWTGCSDTRSQVRLVFEAREDAIAFATREGLDFVVEEPEERRLRSKSYADNFRYNKPR